MICRTAYKHLHVGTLLALLAHMVLKYGMLLLGVYCCSTAVIMIKLSTTDPIYLSAYRLLFASLILSPLFLKAWRKEPDSFNRWYLGRTCLPALALAIHFISWIIGARLTWVANSALIVNLAPIVMPFLMFFIIREKINRDELVGTVLSLFGLAVLGLQSYAIEPEYLIGDFTCLGSMVLFALYLALGRLNRDFKSLWLYLVPCYGIGGLICLLCAFIWGEATWPNARECMLILGLVLIPTIIGHSMLNWAMKTMRGQVVAIVNLGQFVFAGIMGILVFGEWPSIAFYIASAFIVLGAVIVIRASERVATKGVDAPQKDS